MLSMLSQGVAALAILSMVSVTQSYDPMLEYKVDYNTAIIKELVLNSQDYTPVALTLGTIKVQCLLSKVYGDIKYMDRYSYSGEGPRTLLVEGITSNGEKDWLVSIFEQIDKTLNSNLGNDFNTKAFAYQISFGTRSNRRNPTIGDSIDEEAPTTDVLGRKSVPYLPLIFTRLRVVLSCPNNPEELCTGSHVTTLQFVCSEEPTGQVLAIQSESAREIVAVVGSRDLCRHPKYRPDPVPIHCVQTAPWKYTTPVLFSDILHKISDVSQQGIQGLPVYTKRIQADPSRPSRYIITWNSIEGHSYKYHHKKNINAIIGEISTNEELSLGIFLSTNHIKHMREHPEFHVGGVDTYFYSEGSICSSTRRPRTTIVMLVCDPTTDLPILYENEPCEYLLTIRTPFACKSKKENIDTANIEQIQADEVNVNIKHSKKEDIDTANEEQIQADEVQIPKAVKNVNIKHSKKENINTANEEQIQADEVQIPKAVKNVNIKHSKKENINTANENQKVSQGTLKNKRKTEYEIELILEFDDED